MWDRRFGGTDFDFLYSFQQTTDGGFILGGYSRSGIGGDKTQGNYGIYDYWIVKTDSLGNKQWDKVLIGANVDYLYSIQQTTDGGFILGGHSDSGIGYDKTQATWGTGDYWIIKTDSLGNKQWDKDFGGTSNDELFSLQQTSDGGYILGGWSTSRISGNKTQDNWDTIFPISSDFWIVKIDSGGNKQWDKDFGGTGEDKLFSLQQTSDGGYILGGYSNSGISGNKTQQCWGLYDYWIVKTDSLGNKQWDQDFGGTDYNWFCFLQQTPDGGYILGGYSNSGIGGNKTQPCWGLYDYWIVKTDSLGNKQWDKNFGGTDMEELWKVSQTTDGAYLISGDSYSPISGDKTENNFGLEQTWVLKIDSLGNKLWDKTVFTNGHDEQGSAIQTWDGCYQMANSSPGGMAGYKTQNNWDSTSLSTDYWMVKFCDTTAVPIIAFTATSSLCSGTCTSFLNLSLHATSYQWNFFGASPDTSTAVNPQSICYANPGSYDVQLIATNANGSDTLFITNYITVYPFPPSQSITQNGDTLFAIAGATSYQWYFNTNMINGATDYFFIALSDGDYNVVATDGNGCEVEAAVFNVVAGLTPALSKGEGVNLYPNPVEEKLRVRCSEFGGAAPQGVLRTVEISVYNMIGEQMLTQEARIKNQETTIDVSGLTPGMYWLEIKSGEKIFRSKFIKAGNR